MTNPRFPGRGGARGGMLGFETWENTLSRGKLSPYGLFARSGGATAPLVVRHRETSTPPGGRNRAPFPLGPTPGGHGESRLAPGGWTYFAGWFAVKRRRLGGLQGCSQRGGAALTAGVPWVRRAAGMGRGISRSAHGCISSRGLGQAVADGSCWWGRGRRFPPAPNRALRWKLSTQGMVENLGGRLGPGESFSLSGSATQHRMDFPVVVGSCSISRDGTAGFAPLAGTDAGFGDADPGPDAGVRSAWARASAAVSGLGIGPVCGRRSKPQ